MRKFTALLIIIFMVMMSLATGVFAEAQNEPSTVTEEEIEITETEEQTPEAEEENPAEEKETEEPTEETEEQKTEEEPAHEEPTETEETDTEEPTENEEAASEEQEEPSETEEEELEINSEAPGEIQNGINLSGTCGSCSWSLVTSGSELTLTLEPTNGVSGTLVHSWGWDSYRSQITNVIIKDGVKSGSSLYTFFTRFTSLKTADVSGLDTSECRDMEYMFDECSSLTSLDLSGFDTSNVTNMHGLFEACVNLENLNITGWNTSKVTTMCTMFCDCRKLTNVDVSGFVTTNVRDMSRMFESCYVIESIDVSGFDTSKVTTMQKMFFRCFMLKNIDVSGFNTLNVTDMISMFSRCYSLTGLNLSNFNTAKVTNMAYFLANTLVLNADTRMEYIDTLRKTNNGKATDWTVGLFLECPDESIDLSELDTTNATDMTRMFDACTNLKRITVGSKWSTAKVTTSDNMFRGCTSLVGGEGTACDGTNHTDKTYARLDGGTASPGYFSNPKTKVSVPTAEAELKYTGSEQTGVVLPDGAPYTLTGNTGTNIGCYTATAKLNDENNYEWDLQSPTSDNINIAWAITNADEVETNVNTDNIKSVKESYEAKAENEGKAVSVSIDIKDEGSADELEEIKNLTGNKKTDLKGVELKATVDGTAVANVGDTNTELISIAYNFDFTGKKDFQVFRGHTDSLGNVSADELTETPNANGEYVTYDKTAGTITVTACKYSTYAVAYNEITAPVTPTSNVPKTGDNTPLWLFALTALTALAAGAVTIAVSRRKSSR